MLLFIHGLDAKNRGGGLTTHVLRICGVAITSKSLGV